MSAREVRSMHFSQTVSRLLASEANELRRLEDDPFVMYVFYQPV